MIYVDNNQQKHEITEEFQSNLINIIDFALKKEEVNILYEVSLLFVDNEEIREINKKYRGIDKATDVLSFPQINYPKDKVFKDVYINHKFSTQDLDGELLLLGDIVISLEKAEEQRKEYGHSFFRECSYLVVHSVLHLLGYDHMEEHEKTKMREREEAILSELNIMRSI